MLELLHTPLDTRIDLFLRIQVHAYHYTIQKIQYNTKFVKRHVAHYLEVVHIVVIRYKRTVRLSISHTHRLS